MILIDSREHFKYEIQERFQDLKISAHIMKLENYTDYLLTSDTEIGESVAIQRKTSNEVLSKESTMEGYKNQMEEIRDRIREPLEIYGSAWLLVEEDDLYISKEGKIMSKRGKMLYETGMSAKSYYNFLHSVQRSGINVKTTPNWDFSVWWIYSLHGYIQKEHFPKPVRKYTEAEELIGALMGIKGIGEVKAKSIYNRYMEHIIYQKAKENTHEITLPDSITKGKVEHSLRSDDRWSVEENTSSDSLIETEKRIVRDFTELMKEIEEEFGKDEKDN